MTDNKKNRKAVWSTIFGIILVIISIISIILFLLHGQTTVTGQNSETVISSESITCSGENIPYQFLSYDNATKKTAKVTTSFNNNKFNAISLSYTLYYNDTKSIESSKTINSAELNIFYGKDGLPSNSFSKSLYSDNEKVVISLYADTADFNDKTSKYFIADGLGKNSNPESFIKTYEAQGFKCENNNTTKEVNEK